MKILLINNNPVVSRLTALSARKENVELDEIKNVSELKANDYNVVFVDSESYSDEVSNIIKNSGITQKVLFYAQGENENKEVFSENILKPFLPSEVSAILREMKITIHNNKTAEVEEAQEEFVDFTELVDNRDNDLENLNFMKQELEKQSNEEELATETSQEKDSFDLKLEEAFPLKLEDNKPQEPKEASDKISLDDDLFEFDDKKDENSLESDLFELDKEIEEKASSDELLDFDFDSKDEIDFETKLEEKEPEVKIEEEKVEEPTPAINKERSETTKILDANEISNIKDLLNDEPTEESRELTLDELMTPPTTLATFDNTESDAKEEVSEKKKKEEKIDEVVESKDTPSVEVLGNTLGAMPIEDLRRLLRGAKVNISIEFPNEI
ncbi:MAG: hypothetical protein K0U38_12040 [Epsilonproteobacteria bacterium]|nr:hypothetical protein [Campylobacterota bacterium]